MMPNTLLTGRVVGGPASARMTIDGREYINFFGAGYLALTRIPQVRAAVANALREDAPFACPVSAAMGCIDPHFEAVERAGASACGTEASVYFASGYQIGAVGLHSLEQSFDQIVLDEGAHYNLTDAVKSWGLPALTFAHCDADGLRKVLKQHVGPKQRPLVISDGVFATSGRVAPLADYATAIEPYDGRLLVDESHAFGVVGQKGRGAAEYCGVERVTVCGATLSKAFCAQGAIIGCSKETAARLRQVPVLRGATAGSPLSAVAATAGLTYVAEHPELRDGLQALAGYFRTRLRAIGVDVIETPAPIVSFRLGSRTEMLAIQQRLFQRGIHIYHSNYIGAGAEGMIRCAVFRDHSRSDIDALIAELG